MSGPTGCEKHCSAVMDKMRDYFRSMQDLVQSGSAKVHSFAKTEKTPQSESSWTTLSIPNLVDGVVEDFVMLERKRLWEAHEAIIISNLQEALPSAARQFKTYYTEFFLSTFVLTWFNYWIPEGRSTDQLEEWLNLLLKEVVATEIPKLTNDNGQLRDEELVKLYRAGFPECKTLLLERYDTKLRQLTPAIVYSKTLCPESEDPDQFNKDVAQDVAVKLLTEVDSYRFESSFATWVGTICENEAKTRRDKLDGRSKKGKKRIFVSFDELQEQSATPPVIRNLAHREIVRKIMAKHRTHGTRAEKSTDVIEWRYFEQMDIRAIAERLQTTVAYVHQLYSHDYREMRRIGLEDFGVSGTDL
jgi:RNA polymerase sigma factor (sigma-70 family)